MPLGLNGTTGVQDNSGAFVAGTAVASTSGTSIDFTSIPSWVKRITVMFDSVSLSGTDGLVVQLGDSGGIETTGYSSYVVDTATYTSTPTTFFGLVIPAATQSAASIMIGACVISKFNGNTWTYTSTIGYALPSVVQSIGVGSKTLSDVLTQIRITRTGTNTFDAGSINILYE
jgi:hypothetical protein